MSLVWASVKNGVGRVFSDGRTTDNDGNEITNNTNKTFKVHDSHGNTFIGGITGYLKVTKFTEPVGPTGSQGTNGNNAGSELTDFKVEMEGFIEYSNSSPEDFTSELESYFNKISLYDFANNKTFFLIIASWGTLFKVSIMGGKCSVTTIECKNESIGDDDKYDDRKVIFENAFDEDNISEVVFNDVKNNCSTERVGGQTFPQTLDTTNPTKKR